MKYILYILIAFLLPISHIVAGTIEVSTDTQEIKTGDEVAIDVTLVTGNDSYNTVSGIITVDSNLEIKQITTGGSVVSAWIENPSKSTTNIVRFAGIIPGGFNGNGTLFQIILTPRQPGTQTIALSNSLILINDGSGTEEAVTDKNILLATRNLSEGEQNTKIISKDTTPPELFEVLLTKNKNIENDNYVLIFEAVDKGSGVKTYDVLEGKTLFKHVQSPYVLVNQKINERIYVKAIDYDGNERVVKVTAPGKACVTKLCFNQTTAILILVFVLILSFIIWRRQSKELKRISERV